MVLFRVSGSSLFPAPNHDPLLFAELSGHYQRRRSEAVLPQVQDGGIPAQFLFEKGGMGLPTDQLLAKPSVQGAHISLAVRR
jgi:hypothetical protein